MGKPREEVGDGFGRCITEEAERAVQILAQCRGVVVYHAVLGLPEVHLSIGFRGGMVE